MESGPRTPSTQTSSVVLGVLAPPGLARDLAGQLVDELPDALNERYPGVTWEVELRDEEPASTPGELVARARRRLLDRGWELVACLTELPLRSGQRPVTAQASATHAVGIVSVPALGAVNLHRRLREAVVRMIDGLLGERGAEQAGEGGGARGARIRRRLQELASPVGRVRIDDDLTMRFVAAVVRGNVRLLLGMLRANRPWRLVARLSRALAAALAAAAFAVVTPEIWQIADGMNGWRLTALMVATIAGTAVSIVVAHDLWERNRDPAAREQVVLFNLATALTVALGVLTLYLALLALTAAAGAAIIAPPVFSDTVGHPVGLGDYLRLAWFIGSLATVGGALGAAVESDLAVHEAAYGYAADERGARDPDAAAD